jgi:hypothetical protein
MLRVPEVIAREYLQPGFQHYYDGLVHIQGKGVGKGSIIAKGCGHNVPADNPELVANEICELLDTSVRYFESRL